MFHVEHQVIRINLAKFQADETRGLFQANAKKLEEYVDRLMWWNKKINLVSRDVPRETLKKHVEHSLIISGTKLFKNAGQILDAGTGGGLPGLPLALTNSDKQILLNDIVAKKVMACKQIANGMGLNNVKTETGSLENIDVSSETVVVSKHAFKIKELYEMIRQKPWKGIVLLKGENEIEDELKGIEGSLQVKITSLGPGFKDTFYQGKAMVEIRRQGDE